MPETPAARTQQTSAAGTPHTSGRNQPIPPLTLLAIAHKSLSGAITAAARSYGVDDERILNRLRVGGLTPLGRQDAGDLADDIDEIMRERAPNVSWRRSSKMTRSLLLAIAHAAQNKPIAAAAEEHGYAGDIAKFLGLQGLTEAGRQAAGDLALAIDGLMAARDPAMSRPRRRSPIPLVNAQWLLQVAQAARTQPFTAAARACGAPDDLRIDELITTAGLTRFGRDIAGPLATEIDSIITGRQVPRRKITGQQLLDVAKGLETHGSLTASAMAHQLNPSTVGAYLQLRGLTVDGLDAAGPLAGQINSIIRAFTGRRGKSSDASSSVGSTPAMPQGAVATTTASISVSGPESTSRTAESTAPATRANFAPPSDAPAQVAAGIAPSYWLEPAPIAPSMPSLRLPAEPIAARRADAPPAASASVVGVGGNFAMTADALTALARLAVDMPIETASARLGIPWDSVQPFLFATGLSPLGRLIAGPRAWELDRLLASQRIDPPKQTQTEHVQPSKDTFVHTAMQWLDDELDDRDLPDALVDDMMASFLHEIDGASGTRHPEDAPPPPAPARTPEGNNVEDAIDRTVDSWLRDSPGRSPDEPS